MPQVRSVSIIGREGRFQRALCRVDLVWPPLR